MHFPIPFWSTSYLRLLGERQFHGEGMTPDTDVTDDEVLTFRLIQGDAAEVDVQVILQAADGHLKNAAEVLSLGNGPGGSIQEAHALEVLLQTALRAFAFCYVGGDADQTERLAGLIV